MKGTKTSITPIDIAPIRFRVPQKWRGLKLITDVIKPYLIDLEYPKNEGD